MADDLNTRAIRAAERLKASGEDRGKTGEEIRAELVEVLRSFTPDELGEMGFV